MSDHRRISEMLSSIAHAARVQGRPDPVITTDRMTADLIAAELARDIGSAIWLHPLHPRVWMEPGCVAMYAGVKIMAQIQRRTPEDGWREHFGLLADLYEA